MSTKPSTPINRLILIGNGFDLAHGLKTSYSDFILWYFQKSWEIAKSNFTSSLNRAHKEFHQDGLISIIIITKMQQIDLLEYKIENYAHIIEFIKLEVDLHNSRPIKCKIKSDFFRSLVNDFCYKQWVDIENHYYNQLTKIINPVKTLANPKGEVELEKLKKLNDDFDLIKKELENYLNTIQPLDTINGLSECLYEKPINLLYSEYPIVSLVNVMFLNFNYTSTPELYKQENTDIIYIHGELDTSKNNPLIFGYGDERDESYTILEKANNPKVFTHIKSFDYFKTNNYDRLLAFLESKYDVYIMGHSCGLSDRTLLSTIFEHENCRLIKIFYYENMSRYRETTYEISRHFKDKAEMRRKVINFGDCSPMPQLTT